MIGFLMIVAALLSLHLYVPVLRPMPPVTAALARYLAARSSRSQFFAFVIAVAHDFIATAK